MKLARFDPEKIKVREGPPAKPGVISRLRAWVTGQNGGKDESAT